MEDKAIEEAIAYLHTLHRSGAANGLVMVAADALARAKKRQEIDQEAIATARRDAYWWECRAGKIEAHLDKRNREVEQLRDELEALRRAVKPLDGRLQIGQPVAGMKIVGLDVLAGTITLGGWDAFGEGADEAVNG